MASNIDKFHFQGGDAIRQVVFGMNDGVVSIFALLAGLAGAQQSHEVILITLIAATVAGAISMAAGEFISGKSENDYFNHEIEQERMEIKLCPHIEKEELKRIYAEKGFEGDLLNKVVDTIASNKDHWVREMVIDELGTTELHHENSLKSSFVIFIAFVFGASFPTLPYLLLSKTALVGQNLFIISIISTVVGLFSAGAMKKFVTGMNWFKSGIEMLLVGIFAFAISFAIGMIIPI